MYIPSFKLISQSMLKKSPENTDGRTDGQTDGQTDGRTLPRHNTSRFSNGRITRDERVFIVSIFIHGLLAMVTHGKYNSSCKDIIHGGNNYRKISGSQRGLTHCGLVTLYGERSGSTLAQAMACCLMAPSHYLNQCWFILISEEMFKNLIPNICVPRLHFCNYFRISRVTMS